MTLEPRATWSPPRRSASGGAADLTASGRAEAQALGLRCDGAAGLGAAEARLPAPPPRFRRRLAAGPSLRSSISRWPPPARASIRCSMPWRPPSCPVRRVRPAAQRPGARVRCGGGRRGAGGSRRKRCGAGARPHPRRPRAGQDPPPAGAGGVPADPRPAHRGRRAPQPGSGDRQAARAGRTPGTSPDAHARSLPRSPSLALLSVHATTAAVQAGSGSGAPDSGPARPPAAAPGRCSAAFLLTTSCSRFALRSISDVTGTRVRQRWPGGSARRSRAATGTSRVRPRRTDGTVPAAIR